MKEEEIKIRITDELKKDFVDICEFENTTMSNKLHNFIINEIKEKKVKIIEVIIGELLSSMGYDNITIISTPNVNMVNGKLVSNDVEGHIMTTATWNSNLLDLVERYKDKKIFLYLSGSDLPNNKIRGFVI